MRTLIVPFSLSLLFLLGSCASVDTERSQMMASITSAERLSGEISNWRAALTADAPASVIDTIAAFKVRAGATEAMLAGLSADATAGTDLTGLNQALRTVANFDTSTFTPASPSARTALLDQFEGLARNLRVSAAHARQRA